MELEVPDVSMMAVPNAIAGFIASGDEYLLEGIFSEQAVTIVENFAPYLFEGADAVVRWKEGMRAHAEHLEDLRPKFGDPQDFSVTGDQAFFTLPTSWRGLVHGTPFFEEGGWAFLLVREEGNWRLRSYGWAVTHMALLQEAE
ncbi:MAG TPA: hypothetical protein EYO33_07910 [Phycisphaerales bacterium]|nr:hypothetical protein [Phycisphaerales bacterium]